MHAVTIGKMLKQIHDNSRESYKENEGSGRGPTYRQKILDLLTRQSPLTDRQIIDTLGVRDVNNIRPEITRLKQAGQIREYGKTKCPVTGKTVRTVGMVKFKETLF